MRNAIKKIILLFFSVIVIAGFVAAMDNNFKLIKVLGEEERDDYLFYSISGAVLTSCKEIIIADAKGNFIAKYDWDGNFIKRIGQKGQGPGDFNRIASLDLLNDKIYALDQFNRRAVIMDSNLDNLQYIRFPQSIVVSSSLKIIAPDRLISTPQFSNVAQNEGGDGSRLFILDNNGKIVRKFFNHFPIDTRGLNLNNKVTAHRLDMFSNVVYGFGPKRKKILVAFYNPVNPIVFYLYDKNGKMLQKFKHKFSKDFEFPHRLYKTKKLTLETVNGMDTVNVTDIFFVSGHWYVIVQELHYRKYNDVDRKFYFLKFKEDGTLVGEYPIANDFIFYYASPDGYVLGEIPGSGTEQLAIYKVE